MKWKKMFGSSGTEKNRYKNVFPDTCPECGEKYCDTDDFFSKTDDIASAVLETASDKPVQVKINRHCKSCEHIFTLIIDERRDLSKHGIYIRDKFGEMLEMLISEGMDREAARKEMLKLFAEQEHEYPKKRR